VWYHVSMSTTLQPVPTQESRIPRRDTAAWKAIVIKYQQPSLGRAIWQLVDTLVPYAALWYLMYLSLSYSYWLTFALAALAGLFLIRIFIIFHDCGHGSFFKSRLANDIVGFITGVLTLTPYYHWRWEHSIHHATAGSLDRRGTGDVWTMTVEEYLKASRWKRFAYRLARNPFVLFGIAPIYLFMIEQRFVSPNASPRERWSVYWMNVAILGVAALLSWAFGILPYILIHITIEMKTGTTPQPPFRAAPSTSSLASSSGSPATSASTTSTTSARASPTTIWNAATRPIPCSKRSSPSLSSPASAPSHSAFGMSNSAGSSATAT
jgi:fatty acid desaturase